MSSDNKTSPMSDPSRYYLELGSVPEALSFSDIWQAVMRGKWVILICLVIFESLFFYLSTRVVPKYKAEVVVAETNTSVSTTPGAKATISLDVDVAANESLALLNSRKFLIDFIEEKRLLPVIFYQDWDASNNSWRLEEGQEPPSVLKGYQAFKNNILDVSKDAQTDLTVIQIKWRDAEQAAQWANEIVLRINSVMRERAKSEAERTLRFLRQELRRTDSVDIKNSLNELIKVQKAKIVAANVHEEYAYRVIDPARVPEHTMAPTIKIMLMMVGIVLGLFVGITLVMIANLIRSATGNAD